METNEEPMSRGELRHGRAGFEVRRAFVSAFRWYERHVEADIGVVRAKRENARGRSESEFESEQRLKIHRASIGRVEGAHHAPSLACRARSPRSIGGARALKGPEQRSNRAPCRSHSPCNAVMMIQLSPVSQRSCDQKTCRFASASFAALRCRAIRCAPPDGVREQPVPSMSVEVPDEQEAQAPSTCKKLDLRSTSAALRRESGEDDAPAGAD